ncbi:MAG: Ig-like domain-containing protein, partial [Bacteroidia bacterium]
MASGILKKVGISKIAIGAVVITTATLLIVFNPFTNLKAKDNAPKIDPAFAKYIQAFTSGVVSTKSAIKITFDRAIKDSFTYEQEETQTLFDFSPRVDGKAYWVSENTIEFRPTKQLPFGTAYTVNFDLDAVVDKVKKGHETFEFGFRTLDLNVELNIKGLSFIELKNG